MKNTTKLILGGLLLTGISIGTFISISTPNPTVEKSTKKEYSKKEQKALSAKGSIEHYESLRKNVNTGKMESGDFSSVYQQVKNMASVNRGTIMNFIEEGPDNVGGRTRAILVDRNNKDIIFAGSVSGGLFKSNNRGNTWQRVNSFSTVLSISCMAQTKNGTIYVGTGSTYESSIANGGSGGHRADGVWFSTDTGHTFTKLAPTTSFGNSAINAIKADPIANDKVYIGGNIPVKLTICENTNSFTTEPSITASVTDFQISPDGTVKLAGVGNRTYVAVNSTTFTRVSNPAGTGGKIKEAGLTRTEYAISHDKNSAGKYNIYASQVKGGRLGGIAASYDNGQTWTEVIAETPSGTLASTVQNSDPFAGGTQYQGNYDNIISVIPGKPEQFIIGGIDMFKWIKSPSSAYGQMSKISRWDLPATNPQYSHADHHELVWDNTGRLYIGSDGGVDICDNAASAIPSYYPANRGYNVTQFYGIGYSKYGDLIGGSQDNGTKYKDAMNPGTTPKEFKNATGGDGFDCDISHLNENVLISTLYYGAVYRSATKGQGSIFTSPEMVGLPAQFNTVARLFENTNDINSTDSITYLAKDPHAAGETIMVPSKNMDILFPHVLLNSISAVRDTQINGAGDTTFSYSSRDTIRIQDKLQTLMALGLNSSGGVWVTRGTLRFGESPVWWKVLNTVSGRVTALEFSKDGNHLFVGQSSGKVTRVSGFNNVYYNNERQDTINSINNHDSISYNYADVRSGVSQLTITDIRTGGQMVTGIGVDPNNANHVIITLAGYGASTNIMRSTTAATTTTASSFSSIRGGMPAMPMYDAVIDMSDPTRMYVGTEFGVWVSINSGGSWTQQNDEIGNVPVYAVRQQWRDWSECTNSGTLYLGTHGRGIWSSNTFLGLKGTDADENLNTVRTINLYPNPVNNYTNIEFDLDKTSDVTISIYSITGKLVHTKTLNNKYKGEVSERINTSDLKTGSYFVTIQAGNAKYKIAKFIK